MIISQVSYRTNGPLVLIFVPKLLLWVLVRIASVEANYRMLEHNLQFSVNTTIFEILSNIHEFKNIWLGYQTTWQ